MGYTTFTNGTQPALSDTILNNMQVELMKLVFPIGSTYITQTNTNPSEILKFGTWERVKGKVLVGLDENDTDFNEIGKTGGEKTHTLTVDEIPSHKHVLRGRDSTGSINGYGLIADEIIIKATSGPCKDVKSAMDNTGGGQAHAILQPYQVVGYMWRRTA